MENVSTRLVQDHGEAPLILPFGRGGADQSIEFSAAVVIVRRTGHDRVQRRS